MKTPTLRLLAPLLAVASGLLAISVQAATLSGSGNPANESRAVSGFQAIALRGSIDLVVRQGAREGVQLRGDDNLLPLVQTVVEGSGPTRTLRIEFKPGTSVRTRMPLVVSVDVLHLKALSSHGSGDISVESLKTPALALTIAGSSDAKLRQLDAEQFSISIAGSGDVLASGRAAKLEVSIAGSGDVRTRELLAGDVSISIAGSGDASVTAQKTLGVSIAGSGDVDFSGGATLSSARVAGSGSVRQRAP